VTASVSSVESAEKNENQTIFWRYVSSHMHDDVMARECDIFRVTDRVLLLVLLLRPLRVSSSSLLLGAGHGAAPILQLDPSPQHPSPHRPRETPVPYARLPSCGDRDAAFQDYMTKAFRKRRRQWRVAEEQKGRSGVHRWSDGEGGWKNNKTEGHRLQKIADSRLLKEVKGETKANKWEDHGVVNFADGRKFEGLFKGDFSVSGKMVELDGTTFLAS
jgi:hypothetical protein